VMDWSVREYWLTCGMDSGLKWRQWNGERGKMEYLDCVTNTVMLRHFGFRI
jgi:hypothetical protein